MTTSIPDFEGASIAPEANSSPQAISYIPATPVRVEFYEGEICRLVDWDGEQAWSNGYVLFKGTAPQGVKTERTSLRPALQTILDDLVRVYPLCVTDDIGARGGLAVFFSETLGASAKYVFAALTLFPGAEFWARRSCASAPIEVRSNGARVGLIMPLAGYAPDSVLAVLRTGRSA